MMSYSPVEQVWKPKVSKIDSVHLFFIFHGSLLSSVNCREEPRMRIKLVRAGLLTLLLLPDPVSAFTFSDPLGIFGERFDGKRARVECEEKGKLVSNGPIEEPGYLLTINNRASLFEFFDIAKELLSKRFQYLEVSQEYWTDTSTKKVYHHDRGNIEKYATGTGTKYLRFFLSRRGDPSCAGYEKDIKEHPISQAAIPAETGLPRDLCIAARGLIHLRPRTS